MLSCRWGPVGIDFLVLLVLGLLEGQTGPDLIKINVVLKLQVCQENSRKSLRQDLFKQG